MSGNHLAPPHAQYINPEYTVPLSPPSRPPFAHCHSSSSILPATPRTPYPPTRSTTPQKAVDQPSNLREFLGLRARILLTTLSPSLLPFILTIAHLIQNRSSTASLAASLKSSLLAACSGLATGAAGLLTMPRYLAMQTNDQAVRATQASILAIGSAIGDCVTIIEVVVIFIVETYRSLLLCTIELVVRGTLEILIEAVKTISDGITNSLNSIREGIQGDIATANRFIQEAVDRINSLTSRININISVPEFSIPSLSGLQNVQIPTGFEDSLIRLNTTLPTLSELQAKMNDLIEIPFEALKKEINETRIEMAASFNSSILPVPPLSQLSASKASELNTELCGDLDTSLIDDTARALHKLSNVAIGLMFLLLFLIWATMVIWEWRRWRALKDTVEMIEDEWQREGSRDAWRCVAVVENPVLEKYGSPIIKRLAPTRRTRTNIRWYMSYLAHPTCLALLFIALLGFLCIQFQMLALNAIKSHAREYANAAITQSSNGLTSKLNQMALASSQQYATDFNAAIDRYEDRINNELFGHWLNTTAISLNSSINEFYDGVEDVLNKTFGGTILFNPVNTFMYCILGSKIDTLEKGLTWISEHAQVSLPKLPPDVLLLSPESMSEISQPISAAAVGSSTAEDGDDEGVVGSLIRHFENALKVERTFYAILLGVWLGFALVGLIIVIWNSGGSDRYNAWRGKPTSNGSGGMDGLGGGEKGGWTKNDLHPIYDQHTEEEKQFRGLSPTPLTPPIIPRIVEPNNNSTTSFMNYGDEPKSRPFVPRNGTFGSTISSLAAPGQAFLRMTMGKGKSDIDDKGRLTDGTSSEKYNSYHDTQNHQHDRSREDGRGDLPTPPPFWVNKFYRAVDTAKSYFPTRGQKLGQAINEEDVPTRSLGDNDDAALPQPRYPNDGWERRDSEGREWSMVDPTSYYHSGRAIETTSEGDSRYPTFHETATTTTTTYPRRLSRAPTLKSGAQECQTEYLEDFPSNKYKHDSIDYIPDGNSNDRHHTEWHGDRAQDVVDGEESHRYSPSYNYDFSSPIPSSSSAGTSIYHGYADEPVRVESVEKVKTGTAALAAILEGIKRREGQGQGGVDPFFSEGERRTGRGVRI